MERWAGRVAVVTGASSGIGLAIALKLTQNGLKVVGLARRQDKLDELKEKTKSQPGTFYSRKTDMTNKEDIIAAFEWIKTNVGVVSILVNNAGVSFIGSVTDGNFEAWERVFKTNVEGLTIATSLALQAMKENNIDDGHIINMSSVAGRYVLDTTNYSIYEASKHAVTAFTLALRKELAYSKSKIRLTNISPGLVSTELIMTPEYEAYGVSQMPLLNTEDVANVVAFAIASPAHVQVTELTVQATGETY